MPAARGPTLPSVERFNPYRTVHDRRDDDGTDVRRTSSQGRSRRLCVRRRSRVASLETVTTMTIGEYFLTGHRHFRHTVRFMASAVVRCGRKWGEAPAPHHSPQARGRLGRTVREHADSNTRRNRLRARDTARSSRRQVPTTRDNQHAHASPFDQGFRHDRNCLGVRREVRASTQ